MSITLVQLPIQLLLAPLQYVEGTVYELRFKSKLPRFSPPVFRLKWHESVTNTLSLLKIQPVVCTTEFHVLDSTSDSMVK